MTTQTLHGPTRGAAIPLLCLLLAAAAGVGCDDGGAETDAAISHGDGGGGDGAVTDLCEGAACATGSYCDPMTGGCVKGCLGDENCADGFTCNVDAKTCVQGGGDGLPDVGKPDGGTDGGKPDGGGGAGSTIIPGVGIDYNPAGDEHQIRVMKDDYGTMGGIFGAATTPNPDVKWYLSWPGEMVDALFVDTNGSKALDNGDLLNRLVLTEGFDAKTAAGNGMGTARSGFTGELGAAEYTSPLDAGDSMDFFFTKGLNVIFDPQGKAKNITIFKAAQVVPGQEIDWNGMSVFGITSSIQSGSSWSDVQSTLGTPDLVSTSTSGQITTETRTYIPVGMAFSHADQATSDVNTIAVFPPYFGKLSGTTLGLGSTHAEIKAYFDSKHPEKSQAAGTGTIYYYEIKQETVFITTFAITVGFVYNASNQATTILVGYPIKK